MKQTAILLLLMTLLYSCILNNRPVQNDIYVYETIKWYDSRDSLYETKQFTIDAMSVTGRVVGEEYPMYKYTLDDHGNRIESIAYDEQGLQRHRRIDSYIEYRSGVYVRRNYSVYNNNDSLTFRGYFDLVDDTLKFKSNSNTFYSSYSILNERGDDIEYLQFDESGDIVSREVYTYQLLIDDIYVIASSTYYNANGLIVYQSTNSLDGMCLYSRELGNDHISSRTTFDEYGNILENLYYDEGGEQSTRYVYTYQLLIP